MSNEQAYRTLFSDVAERATRYLEQVPTRSVFPSSHALSELDRLGGKLPDRGEASSSILALLDDFGSPATVASTGGRYFGFVVRGALPVALGCL